LKVVIKRSQGEMRRQMQGSRTGAAAATEDAVKRGSEKLIAGLPGEAILAVLNISAGEKDTAAFIMEELEFRLLESGKFKIVDRKSLDTLRAEQNFQMSGAVSDESAVSIGNMLGANIVITGALSNSAGARRLTLRALDVQSAEIVAGAREDF
jgi:TolB-like protein